MNKKRYRIVVSGRVQGVFYRATTKAEALRLGLTGYVKNLPTGDVEVVAEGITEKLDSLAAFCEKGPPGALVTNFQLEKSNFTGAFDTFNISY